MPDPRTVAAHLTATINLGSNGTGGFAAMSADGATVATRNGAGCHASVRRRASGSWSVATLFTCPVSDPRIELNRIIVNADGSLAFVNLYNDLTGMNTGYVVARSADTWTVQQQFGPTPGDLSTDPAFSEDGTKLLIWDSEAGRGFYRVYTRSGDTWTLRAPLEAPAGTTAISDVTLSGDGNTAFLRVTVGSSSAVAVFLWNGAAFVATGQISAGPGESFSGRAAVDQTGDTVLIYCQAGSWGVCAFSRQGGAWTRTQTLYGYQANDAFGNTISLTGDQAIALSGDGSIALISARGTNTYQGAAYLFDRKNGTWIARARLVNPASEGVVFWGETVMLSRDARSAMVRVPGPPYEYSSPSSPPIRAELIDLTNPPGDLDGDWRSDLVWRDRVTGDIIEWLMNGTSVVSEVRRSGPTDRSWKIRAVADFDGDGRGDLLWRNDVTGQNQVWFRNGTAAWLTTVADVNWQIDAAADFNGDGHPDILWRHRTSGENIIWHMDGTVRTGYVRTLTVPDTNWRIAAAADFNLDGSPDILWRHHATGENIVWYMHDGEWQGYERLDTVSDLNWLIVGAADVNDDGRTDVLWRHVLTGENTAWCMNGAARSGTGALPGVTDATWDALHAADGIVPGPGDFNIDGFADVLWRNATTGQNLLWYMNGRSRTSVGWLDSASGADWRTAATADFNGDGFPDVFWRNVATGDNIIWFLQGTSFVSYARVDAVPTSWQLGGVGDFDGDGRPDLLWRNPATGENIVWFMNGASFRGYARIMDVAGASWEIAGVADFNGDQRSDIFWRDTASGENIVWFMNGISYAGYTRVLAVADPNWIVASLGDFSGDRRPDILWRNTATGENIIWYLNGTSFVSYGWITTLGPEWRVGR